jgi:murein hydrolase activator
MEAQEKALKENDYLIPGGPQKDRRLQAVLAAALISLAPAVGGDDAGRDTEALEQLRARIQVLQQTLEQDRSRRGELRQILETTERRMADLQGELATLRRRIAEQTARQRQTAAEREQAEAALNRHYSVLAQQVRAAYIIGQRGKAKLLLNQDHTEQMSRVMTYYDYLNRARARHIEDVRTLVQTLQTLETRLRQETAELESMRSEHEGRLTALEAARAERQEMVKQLGQRIVHEERELRQLRADERQLSRLIRELQTVLADVPGDLGTRPLDALRGQLPWPVAGRLLAGYGQPKAGGALKWNGLWIAGREGDPVRAVARGRVAYVGWMHRYGLIVVLEHEGGYYTLYGHAQSAAVAIGDWVNGGDVIANVGATGGHEKPGLYFELRKGTDPINPRPWLRKS